MTRSVEERSMLKRIVIVAVVVVCCIGGWMLYNRNQAQNALGNGDVHVTDSSSKSSDTANTDLDGNAAHPTPSRSDAPGTVNGEPVNGTTSNQPPESMKAPIASANPPATVAAPTALPVSDTVAPNPPNGLAFGGTGKFQWYRQGNLTWRVNTTSGSTCIAFATMEEWQKPIVYSHGCGNA